MPIPKFTKEVYPRQAFIYCNEHGTRLCYCFEFMEWEKDVLSPDRACTCLKERKHLVELYFINRFKNKKFD